jgi:hypothetical protein
MARSEDYRLDNVPVSFSENLFVARANEEGGKPKFGATFLLDKARDNADLDKLIVQAAEAEWPGKAMQMFKDGLIKSPYLDGDGPQAINKKSNERYKGYAGRKFIRCTSGAEHKPQVVDRKVVPIVTPAEIPSGSIVNAYVHAFTWQNDKGGKGVTFGVSMVQLVKKATGDEVLGGGGGAPDPTKHFEKLADEGAAPDSTKTGKGASGLFG